MINNENLLVVTLAIAIVALVIASGGVLYTKTSFSNLASVVSTLRGQANLTQGNILAPPLTIYYDGKTKGKATALREYYKRMYGKEADIQLSDISAGDWDTNGRNDLILKGENPIEQCCASAEPQDKSCITTDSGKELCYTTPKCVTEKLGTKNKIPLANYTIPCKDKSGGGYISYISIGGPVGDGHVMMMTEPNLLTDLDFVLNDFYAYAMQCECGWGFSEDYIAFSVITGGGGWGYSTNYLGNDSSGSFKELSPCTIASRICGITPAPPKCSTSGICAADGVCNKNCDDYCYCDLDCVNFAACQPRHKCEGLERACWNFITYSSKK